MTTLYHNPRCSKSREALELLETRNENFVIRKYLDEPLTLDELKSIVHLLKIKPIALVRTQEEEWKHNFKDKSLSDAEILEAMVRFPKLVERPIVVKNGKAAIGRPVDQILEIL